MKIINISTNNSISTSQQTNGKSPLLEKIKKLIHNLFHFIQKNTPSIHQSNRAISKQVNTPLDLSHEILKVLEQKNNSTEHKRDLTLITFLFKEPIYDVPTSNKLVFNEPIYDIPTNNEPIYLDMDKHIYDTPMNNKPVLDEPIYEEINEPIYAEIYDVPRNNKPVLDEPIYEEINESASRIHDKKPMIDIPPPLPPRNW